MNKTEESETNELLNLAVTLHKQQEYFKSADLFEQCLELSDLSNVQKSYAAHVLGSMYYLGQLGEQDLNKTKEYYKIAYEFDTENYSNLNNLAWLYYLTEDYEKAIYPLIQCFHSNKDPNFTADMKEKCALALALAEIYSSHIIDIEKAGFYLQMKDAIKENSPYLIYYKAMTSYLSENYSKATPLLHNCTQSNEISDDIKAA